MLYDNFAERLLIVRNKNGLTLQAVADATGISKTHLSDMEHGRHGATLEKLLILADFYSVSTDYLLGRTENPQMNT